MTPAHIPLLPLSRRQIAYVRVFLSLFIDSADWLTKKKTQFLSYERDKKTIPRDPSTGESRRGFNDRVQPALARVTLELWLFDIQTYPKAPTHT